MLALVLFLAAAAPIDVCRGEEAAFDAQGTIAACATIADMKMLPVDDRVDAFRRLAAALVLKSRIDEAEQAFLRMLILDGTAKPGADAGPDVLRAFRAAQRLLDEHGAISADFTVSADRQSFILVVHDPLGRSASVTLTLGCDGCEKTPALSRVGRVGAVYAGEIGRRLGDDQELRWSLEVVSHKQTALEVIRGLVPASAAPPPKKKTAQVVDSSLAFPLSVVAGVGTCVTLCSFIGFSIVQEELPKTLLGVSTLALGIGTVGVGAASVAAIATDVYHHLQGAEADSAPDAAAGAMAH